ncbi:gluconate:H+ symporter [Cellvibrio sp. pealriver]|uniref:gluconate:H+ symporter n=1 Tax=Cellvibrio sp. pealriver TaxID=1622269 RepID=UPI00066FBA2A|nr:gluconate:H+ symporter [Cellvibrio sp. pealriver]
MAIAAVIIAILILVVLITWVKLNPFLAFLVSSVCAAIMLGIPLDKIPATIETGIGGMLGSLAVILCLGAMFGKLVAESGAAQQISSSLMRWCGKNYITWALLLTGFIVGIPLFYNVGFVLLVPLVFSVMHQTKLPAVYLGIPLLAALSVTHGFLPPHPSPVALIPQFGADMGTTLLYGLLVAIPTMIIAGPIFSSTLKNIHSVPLATFKPADLPPEKLPGIANSFVTALLPVLLIALTSLAVYAMPSAIADAPVTLFFANSMVVLMIALAIATYSLGIKQGMSIGKVMAVYGDAIKDIAVILLIVAGAGALKQVMVVSGVSDQLAHSLENIAINPLILAWSIATVIRIALGSATVAGLTAAGIVAPLIPLTGADPNLMVLAIGAGSLMCSHVNDAGFWMYKEYFNLSLKDTFKSWSLMETIIGVVGLMGVLALDVVV